MAENQYYPSTAGNVLVNGVEVENQDLALVGQVSGLSDDRVLAELLRLQPTDGTHVAKCIIPYMFFPNPAIQTGSSAAVTTTVAPTNSANGSVLVNPFRVVLGSRTPLGTNTLQNWRDGRSAVFVNAVSSLAQTVSFAPNGSGNPRWDLVYVSLTVDGQANQVQRRVKSPSTSAVGVQTVFQYLANTAAINVVPGTPGVTPALPSLPADSGGVYNVPLAYVRITSTYSGGFTFSNSDIRDAATVVPISRATGAISMRPANGNNDGAGTYATNFGWVPNTANSRPSVWMPPSMVGGEQLVVEVDATNATPANWSHPPGSVIDNSVDWRNRFFKIYWAANSSSQFATDPAAGTTRMPLGQNPAATAVFLANSFAADAFSTFGAGTASLCVLTSTNNTQQTTSSQVGLYVELASGRILWGSTTSPAPHCTYFFWVEASGQFPNA